MKCLTEQGRLICRLLHKAMSSTEPASPPQELHVSLLAPVTTKGPMSYQRIDKMVRISIQVELNEREICQNLIMI